jgi:hypothetical protein
LDVDVDAAAVDAEIAPPKVPEELGWVTDDGGVTGAMLGRVEADVARLTSSPSPRSLETPRNCPDVAVGDAACTDDDRLTDAPTPPVVTPTVAPAACWAANEIGETPVRWWWWWW